MSKPATVVVNVRTQDFDVYIGRAVRRARDPRCRLESPWCNPIVPRGRVIPTVEEAISHFEAALFALVDEDPRALRELRKLRGKRLGCWCKPGPCHGDAIVRVLDRLEWR